MPDTTLSYSNLSDAEKKEAARQFVQKWAQKDKGKEKKEDQSFWIEFLQNILGVANVTDRIEFQKEVIGEDGNQNYIDAYISETKTLIEQKSKGIDLSKPQPGHNNMTPYQQAKAYDNALPHKQKAKWIVLSNFSEIWVYDMDSPKPEPTIFPLQDVYNKTDSFSFLVNKEEEKLSEEMEISIKAGEFVGLIYDALLKEYMNPESEETQKSLNILCVRLVFCLYAEDAHIFGTNGHMFRDYMAGFSTGYMRKALIELFKVLNTPIAQRDKYDTSDVMKFPYVNGGLFEKEDVEIPNFTEEIKDILLTKASDGFDWSNISPTIFGAVFESTLNPETRRKGGMHYTSIENIHKVIDPLFLDDLKNELNDILAIQVVNTKKNKLEAFQDKLASLTWLDPAAGSGNFLTETYISIRKLENQVIRGILDCKKGSVEGQIVLGDNSNLIKVNINQFYGIEINDFAVTVAKTALWIAESQMMKETEIIVHQPIDFLPLKTNANIVEGNALRIDWENIIQKEKLSYIMGNPPFVGVNYMSDTQREDMDYIWNDTKRGKLDYVTCWYVKASNYMVHTPIKCALVSTNSVSQGEQATVLWKKLFGDGINIDFAHRTFIWDSEASIKAHVHCVIIGFSYSSSPQKEKLIFSKGSVEKATTINGYLLNAPIIVIEETSNPLCNIPAIVRGSQATDDGHYLFTPEEKEEFIKKEPQSEKYFKRFMMGREFINNIERWCLWMPNISPADLKSCPELYKRVQNVKDFRLSSKNSQTQQAANTPWRFGQYRPPAKNYIAFAKVSSERRRYVPFGFLTDDIIPGDKLFTIPDANMYMFGILTSNVHMAWMRTVCGRLKSDYSYSTTIVYNNFPWPSPTAEQKAKIEKTAQGILDARAKYPDCSLADLYDETTMPPELRKAHQMNDRAVMEAYGFSVKDTSEADCVAKLMKMYQELVENKEQ